MPQFSCNIETDLERLSSDVITRIADEENARLNKGRVLVRKSGTEPLLRITVESNDETQANHLIESIKSQINQT